MHQDYIVEDIHVIEDQEAQSNLRCGYNPKNLSCDLSPTSISLRKVSRTSLNDTNLWGLNMERKKISLET